MAMTDWAVATADAGSGDPEYSIPRTDQGGSITVRIPLGTRPTPPATGTSRCATRAGIETDFWQAATTRRPAADLERRARRVSFPLGAVNERTTGWGGNAANTPLRAGLVTPEDLAAAMAAGGGLPYTLQFGMPKIGAGLAALPGAPQRADG